jgi:transposase-like protein
MKLTEQNKAVELRKQGVAMGEIAQRLGVAKSSVSLWVRDVKLTTSQLSKLNRNGHSIEAIEKRRTSRLAGTKAKRDVITEQALLEAEKMMNDALWCVGTSLYWGEGGKTQNMVRLANSDPAVLSVVMRYFRITCAVPEHQFRGHIHTFAHCDEKKAERYWSDITGIPLKHFFKTYKKQSSASKSKRETLPMGTCQVYVHDTKLFFRIMAWIEYLKKM